jgi:hypothetical protein
LSKFDRTVMVNFKSFFKFFGVYTASFFDSETIGVRLMANIWEKAISISVGNLSSGLSYYNIITVTVILEQIGWSTTINVLFR